MADDLSRLWKLSDKELDKELLTHFEFYYRQSEPWQLPVYHLAVTDSEIMINITRIYVSEVKYLDFRHFCSVD
jgi:hypothetical protein